jgi:poly-gamma-glutamate synthesis protein (capsule biosynthesis protein)
MGKSLSIGLGGDLMIGRGVDNHLTHVPLTDVWGTLLPHLKERDFNFVNLETTLTRSQKINIKVFNFKADPEKVAVLTAGKIEAVNLANNHILDFSEEGLLETIRVLDQAHILHVGAGKNSEQAKAPCIIEKKGIKVGFLGCTDNEPTWKATSKRPGTFFLNVGDLRALRSSILALRKKVDLLVLSIHWGPNMRQRPTSKFRVFARELIDLGVDILHGHSAHIFQGVEVYKQKLILYDTGDFVDDYANDPVLRNDWSFFFVITADKNRVISLQMIPTQIARYQVNVSKETRILDRMEKLCKELNSYPVREGNSLKLEIE